MSDEQQHITCSRCRQPLDVHREDLESSLCETCKAELDAEIEADESDVKAMLEEVSDDLPPGPAGLPEAPSGEEPLKRQRRYTTEDRDWATNDPYFGRNPRDRDP